MFKINIVEWELFILHLCKVNSIIGFLLTIISFVFWYKIVPMQQNELQPALWSRTQIFETIQKTLFAPTSVYILKSCGIWKDQNRSVLWLCYLFIYLFSIFLSNDTMLRRSKSWCLAELNQFEKKFLWKRLKL